MGRLVPLESSDETDAILVLLDPLTGSYIGVSTDGSLTWYPGRPAVEHVTVSIGQPSIHISIGQPYYTPPL